MNLNCIKIFIRNFKRQKIISAINIIGLVTGLLSSLFIMEYVFFERSFDDYHQHASNVYRVVYDRYQHEKLQWKTANSFYPTGKWMKDNYSEVEDYAIISRNYNITVNYENAVGDKVFYYEPKTYYASGSLFKLFTFSFVQGSKNSLDQPNSVAVSDRAAKRYFGNENPIGKTLTVNSSEIYTVKAVYKTIPKNSHLQTDFLFSLPTLINSRQWVVNNWDYDYFHTYLLLKPGTDAKAFTRKAFPDMISKNYQSGLNASDTRDEFFLQALPDIHLHSNIEYETENPGNAQTTSILFGFSLFLLVIAWINYINLITAQSIDRAREIGIKKINGAVKFSLATQFIVETFLFNLICLFITIILFVIINPFFCSVTQILDFSLFSHAGFLTFGTLIFISGILLSAIYPVMVLSSYKPIAVLKGKFKNSAQGILFRKALVTVQFVISIMLLTGTLITHRQVGFLMKKDMGINFSKSLVIRSPRTTDNQQILQSKLLLFKSQVLQLPEVQNFTFSSDIPGQEIEHWFAGYRKGYDNKDTKAYFQIAVDDRFLDFYQVKLLAGRKFYPNEQAAQHNILMNVQAMQRFGYNRPEDAVDQTIVTYGNNEYRVVGILDDFQYKSIKTKPVPTVLTLEDDAKSFLTLRIQNGEAASYASLLGKLDNLYQQNFPNQPFEFISLEDRMLLDLKPDKTFASVFGLFSLLAILIAVIGIIGLILITVNQNMKELGIRRVLGAERNDVSTVLFKQLQIQFIVALTVSVPLSFYGFENWFLSSYVHRIDLNLWFFVVPVVLIAIIVFSVVFLLSFNAFRLKVVTVLKYE